MAATLKVMAPEDLWCLCYELGVNTLKAAPGGLVKTALDQSTRDRFGPVALSGPGGDRDRRRSTGGHRPGRLRPPSVTRSSAES
jgi:hypothetical protein